MSEYRIGKYYGLDDGSALEAAERARDWGGPDAEIATGSLTPDAVYLHQEYLERDWDVKCAICLKTHKATQSELEKAGWRLMGFGEYCPEHCSF
ncbi:MAG: hypothetical protein KF855_03185 [Acidobacteria bacterium]|nr:hypothetical protein [Acidobacteriota bacterium]